jgi:hypothetical protein
LRDPIVDHLHKIVAGLDVVFDVHEKIFGRKFLFEALINGKRKSAIVITTVADENLSVRDDFSVIRSGHAQIRKNLVSSHNRMSKKFKACAESNPQKGSQRSVTFAAKSTQGIEKTTLPMVRQAHHEDQPIENTQPHPEPVEG